MARLSAELETALRNALEEAMERKHEFAGLEHLLFALLADEKTVDVIRHCGGNPPRLRAKLDQFLRSEVKALTEVSDVGAQATLGLQRVLQRAINHVIGAGKDEVAGANVLVAMYAEPESHAV